MVFSSFVFLFYFLPATLALYYAAPARIRGAILTAASYIFYGWWNPAFCLLMLFSTAVDYFCGKWVAAIPRGAAGRWKPVALSVVTNLALLGWFKYAAFVADNLNRAAASLGLEAALPVLAIALPVGISFYTFQSMSYCIDVYRGDAPPARSFLDFACFVSLFPQLVAGPIVRYRELAGQLIVRRHSAALFSEGIARFTIGLSKKVLIANPCGAIADAVFGATALDARCAWLGVTAYAFQIYFDFSGYSDMAIGLGRMLGFTFPENFRSPYRATSMSDFWRRWHITLSAFLRDYLYIPLGGNRRGTARTYFNLFLVMFLGGLWHGAQWTFVLWGCAHGLFLALERVAGGHALYARTPHAVQVAATFTLTLLCWVLFRAENLEVAGRVYAGLFGFGEADSRAALLWAGLARPYNLVVLAAAAVLTWAMPRAAELSVRPLTPLRAVAILLLFALSAVMLLSQGENPFLYFQF